jgi:hypothetical protein
MVSKSTIGIITIRGLLSATAALAANTLLFVLPVGFRPDSTMLIQANQSDTSSYIRINANGEVRNGNAMSLGQYLAFNNVHYPAAGVATWTTMTGFLNGWHDYGLSEYGVARYWIDPYGFAWFAGMISSGTTTNGTAMWTIPKLIMPGPIYGQHMSTVSNAGLGIVRFNQSNDTLHDPTTLDFLTGSNTWLSLAGLSYVTGVGLTRLTWNKIDYMLSSWVDYNDSAGGNMPSGWVKRPDGLVVLKGLIKSGTIGSSFMSGSQHILPRGRNLMQVASNTARGRLDFAGPEGDAVGRLFVPTQGSNAWYSIDNVYLTPGG